MKTPEERPQENEADPNPRPPAPSGGGGAGRRARNSVVKPVSPPLGAPAAGSPNGPRPLKARLARKPVRPVPWVSRLRLRPDGALRRRLESASRFTAMPEEEVASAILSRVDSARPRFSEMMTPRPPGPGTGARPPRGQACPSIEVRVSRKLLNRLNHFSARSGLSPERIASLILKECSLSGPQRRAVPELLEQRQRDLKAAAAPKGAPPAPAAAESGPARDTASS